VRKDAYAACYDYLLELEPVLRLEHTTENFTIRGTRVIRTIVLISVSNKITRVFLSMEERWSFT
jgi:hypothetical protein